MSIWLKNTPTLEISENNAEEERVMILRGEKKKIGRSLGALSRSPPEIGIADL